MELAIYVHTSARWYERTNMRPFEHQQQVIELRESPVMISWRLKLRPYFDSWKMDEDEWSKKSKQKKT